MATIITEPIKEDTPSATETAAVTTMTPRKNNNTENNTVGTTTTAMGAITMMATTTQALPTSTIEISGLAVNLAEQMSSTSDVAYGDCETSGGGGGGGGGAGAASSYQLAIDASVAQTHAWLRARRFHTFQATFASFSASDILRLSRDDLIQICGLADGIRLFNSLHSKPPTPKLTLYFALESKAGGGCSSAPWRVIYLENLNSALLASKLLATLNLPHDRLHSIIIQGPQGVHVLVSNELVANIKDESMYLVETIKGIFIFDTRFLLSVSFNFESISFSFQTARVNVIRFY